MSISSLLSTFNEEKIIVKEGPKYVEKDTGGVSLKGVLQRGRLKLRAEKSVWAKSLTFSPSSITYNYCKRAKVGQLAGILEIYDPKPTPRLQLTFDLGHAIHDIIQGYMWDIGILTGSFKCLVCDTIYHGLVAPTECPVGHRREALKYKEIKLYDQDHLISGRTDGILLIDDEKHIMDIKSISNRTLKTSERQFCFEDLAEKGPKPDHIVQLNFYMWMSGVHRGHLLYVAKNEPQIKTFAIPYDELVVRPYLDDIMDLIRTARDLKDGKRVELPVPCGAEICNCQKVPSKL